MSHWMTAMRVITYVLLLSAIILAVTAVSLQRGLLTGGVTTLLAIETKANNPTHIVPGIPYVIGDQYAKQVCISSREGRPLPPFIVPAGQVAVPNTSTQIIKAGIPFVIQDGYSTELCISSHG